MSSVSFSPNAMLQPARADNAHRHYDGHHSAKSEKLSDERHRGHQGRHIPGATEAQRQTSQRVIDSLNGVLAKDGLSVPPASEYDDFTPDKVAGRILSFVEAGIARAEGDEAKLERLEQARAGIQAGLDDARDILNGLGVLQGEIKNNVDRTENLLVDGLDRLQERVQSGEEPAVAMLRQVSRSQERTASVQIETRDGDTVTIDISRSRSMTRTVMAAEDGDNSIRAMSVERTQSSSLSYSVQGELDDDEREAINDLLKNLDKVSRKFFNGHIDQAFNKAAKLDYDQDELASFAFSAEQTVSRQAVSAYVANSDVAPEQSESIPGTVKNYVGEIASLIDEDMPKVPLRQPIEAIQRLFTEIMQSRAAEQDDDEDRSSGLELLRDLVEKIAANYEQPEPIEQDDETVQAEAELTGTEEQGSSEPDTLIQA